MLLKFRFARAVIHREKNALKRKSLRRPFRTLGVGEDVPKFAENVQRENRNSPCFP